MFRLITINFSQKSPHFSLLSPTSPCELSEREVTSPSNMKVVGALVSLCNIFSMCCILNKSLPISFQVLHIPNLINLVLHLDFWLVWQRNPEMYKEIHSSQYNRCQITGYFYKKKTSWYFKNYKQHIVFWIQVILFVEYLSDCMVVGFTTTCPIRAYHH